MQDKNQEAQFKDQYQKLNTAQKEAVDAVDGPLMVVAGPGTGKTQILALRIANILKKTDTKAADVLCLTFTNSAVEAMKARLAEYIGDDAEKVNIFTFHSFGMKIVEEYYGVLGLSTKPTLLDEGATALLFDEILQMNDWQYLRPRGDSGRYFSDLKSIISLLKRERITAEYFLAAIEEQAEIIEKDENNISTRGESKGHLKKEVLSKIEGLERSKEVSKFFTLYEKVKKEKNVFDYDDVLENLVKITELSPDAVSDLREKYLYILVDEHQDSSRVQNEFLRNVWASVESPNIFVVGDDRQLIYGFSGASIDHFQAFQKTFKDSKLITLVDNYRSTQVILDASHALLQSTVTGEKLISKGKQSKEHFPIKLLEAEYQDDEIIACALDIKEKIKTGVRPNDCALLVPKNAQVRNALRILHEEGLPVSSLDALNLFDEEEAQACLRVLKIISDPNDAPSLARSFFDALSQILPLEAHAYIAAQNMREFSLDAISGGEPQKLFEESDSVQKWIQKILKWRKDAQNHDVLKTIQIIGEDLLLPRGGDMDKLVSGKEILDTILGLTIKEVEKNSDLTLLELSSFFDRLESYGEHVPLIIGEKEGIKVLTLHSSKGLEFDYVWIAHMDERSFNSGKKMAFTLPETIAEKIMERDADAEKRKLYVAITRAKRFCTVSYALYSSKDAEQEVAKIIENLPEEVFHKEKFENAQKISKTKKDRDVSELTKLVTKKYPDKYVSASLLNNFFECPWKWYFRNLLQIPEPKMEILEFGTAVHVSIDRILKMENLPKDEEVENIIREEVSRRDFADERAVERITKEVRSIILVWVKNRLPQIKLNRSTEQGISIKDERFPQLKIYGRIDLIEKLDGENVRVTDFKTGSVKRKSEIEKIDEEGRLGNLLRQLAMYSYLAQNNSKGKLDVRESRLEFLESKNSKESLYDRIIMPKEIELLQKDIADYDHSVKNGEWVSRPCNYNSYGKNIECEYCALAEIFK